MSISSAHSSYRSTYRGPEENGSMETLSTPSTAMVDGMGDQHRGSAGSGGRSSSGRSKPNPQQQLSTIEKSVTHLLVATKQLLETLTMWSRGTATEAEVSDVYVRLGYEFNIACRAFSAIGVDTADLGPVPDLLRAILEDTLSQEASQASLDKYLPRIRDIIINLLHGLKKKQQRLRQKGSGGGSSREGGLPPRQGSVASNLSADTSVSQQLEDFPSRSQSSRSYAQRQGSGDVPMPDLPPRTTSAAGPGRQSPRRTNNSSPANSIHQSASRDTVVSDSGSSMSSNAMQNIPVIAPYPETDTIPTNTNYEQRAQQQPPDQLQGSPSGEPPRPPPKQNDALSALQRGGDLERRASRRFSQYQIQKHLGTSINGVPAIPQAQHSPIPNRGRDVRESMNAVRSRGSVLHSRARSKNQGAYEPSPNRINEVRRISEETDGQHSQSALEVQPPNQYLAQPEQPDSPMIKTPEDKLASYPFPDTPSSPQKFSATLNGPLADEPYAQEEQPNTVLERRKTPTPARSASRRHVVIEEQPRTPPVSQYVPEGSPQAGKELTLFLQYKSKIKKFVLPDGGDLSLARLQLAFIEKFAWNTQNNGADLPEIYIQDPVSGVRHELEDLTDIKERSVLVLNIEALDEVKRHIDDGLGGLRRIVEGIKTSVEDQQSAIQRVSDRQQDAAKGIASIAAAPPAAPVTSARDTSGAKVSSKDNAGQLGEVQKLRRDLAVLRQTLTSSMSDMNSNMTTIRTKASSVKTATVASITPDAETSTGRTHINKGKKQLSDDSEKIVNRVDDLQDLVEDLRKDVVTRGVRPVARQLESVSKDISLATADLKKLKEFLKREKPVWTKIWENELQIVCEERDLLTLQEELAVDLEDDLEKAAATFALVEQATKQQNLQNQKPGAEGAGVPGPGQLRSSSRGVLNPLAIDRGADPRKAKDSVLGEVRALQPNHESRLEAIERAERARQRELESREGGEFQRELGSFVEAGKLKKTGGVDEVERIRLAREEKARRDVLETQQRRMRERAEKEAAEAAGVNGVQDGGAGDLDVPAKGDGESQRESSPESGFVDAREDVGTPSNEPGPP